MYTSEPEVTSNRVVGLPKTLSITNQFSEFASVELWLEQISQYYHLSENSVFKLDLVLNEALANILSYAYDDEIIHNILIKLENNQDNVILEIIDDGKAYNPFETAPLPQQITLESATINGRGIHLIKAYTDIQDYQRMNNTNIMRVTIYKVPENTTSSPENIV